ncbi:exonuclease [Microbacterium phage Zooman]|nr:exonuclease [Microbacterium phage Zooman]
MNLVGIDFEMANPIAGSLCAFGLAHESGAVEKAVIRLHPEKGGEQERFRYHKISPAATALGLPPLVLYSRLQALPEDTVLVAHDAKIDKRQLYAWFEMFDLEPIDFPWFDTLLLARREFGKHGKTGVAAMADRLGMTVKAHDPADDARVALKIAQTYDWGKFVPMLDGKPWKMVS